MYFRSVSTTFATNDADFFICLGTRLLFLFYRTLVKSVSRTGRVLRRPLPPAVPLQTVFSMVRQLCNLAMNHVLNELVLISQDVSQIYIYIY